MPTSTHPAIAISPQEVEELAARLRAVGQRATPQRLLILSAFRHMNEHIAAEEIFCRVESWAPGINRSTVYRTLELFRDLGLISETDMGGGARMFELLENDRHHHLVCRQCDGILDLEDELVDILRQSISQKYEFRPEIDHLAVFGICTRCAETAEE